MPQRFTFIKDRTFQPKISKNQEPISLDCIFTFSRFISLKSETWEEKIKDSLKKFLTILDHDALHSFYKDEKSKNLIYFWITIFDLAWKLINTQNCCYY